MAKVRLQRKLADFLRKPKDMRRKVKLKHRYQFGGKSVLNAITEFLLSDSFMYGPLETSSKRVPGGRYISGTEKQSGLRSPAGILKESSVSPGNALRAEEPVQEPLDHMEENSEIGGHEHQSSYIKTVHMVTKTTTKTVEGKENGDMKSGISGTIQRSLESSPARSMAATVDTEIAEQEMEGQEEQSWGHEGDSHIPLDRDVAEQVSYQLQERLGGRFSEDLGINVDVSDSEVERWFLAASLFSRSLPSNVSKQTFKELQEAGVSTITDCLNLEEEQLAGILMKAGYTKYGQRVAAQLQKLGLHLEEENWGRVSTYKHTSQCHELVRQLRSLPGVKLSTARIFLRELRGVWKGATPDYEMQTKRAAVHLKLLGSTKASSNPEEVLTHFAQAAGIDIRDLEVALYKLGADHEKNYNTCPGGPECEILISSERLLSSLP